MDCKSKGSPSKLRDVPFEHSHVLPCAMRELRRYSTSTTPMVLNGAPVPARSCKRGARCVCSGACAREVKSGRHSTSALMLLAAELLDIASGTSLGTGHAAPAGHVQSLSVRIPNHSLHGRLSRVAPTEINFSRGHSRKISAFTANVRSQPLRERCRLVPQRGWWRWCSCWCPVKECASSPRNSLPLA
jgi:hypothetical protein